MNLRVSTYASQDCADAFFRFMRLHHLKSKQGKTAAADSDKNVGAESSSANATPEKNAKLLPKKRLSTKRLNDEDTDDGVDGGNIIDAKAIRKGRKV